MLHRFIHQSLIAFVAETPEYVTEVAMSLLSEGAKKYKLPQVMSVSVGSVGYRFENETNLQV